MEKQELKSKWDELARELGAEIPPETEQREQALSTATAETTPPPASQSAARTATVSPPSPPPKRSAADWNKLAGDLGLPPIEPEADHSEPTIEQRRPSPPPVQVAREPAAQRPGREPRRTAEPREPRELREPRGERGPREKRRVPRGAHRRHADREREPRTPDGDMPRERHSESTRQAEAEARPPADAPQEPSKPASVSLWHKIFGSPAEQSAKLTESPAAGSQPQVAIQPSDEENAISSSDEIRSLSGAEVAVAGFVEGMEGEDDSALASDETAPAERTRGRTRRRRRGGRGRKTSEGRIEGRRSPRREEARSRDVVEVGEDFDDLGLSGMDEEDSDTAAPADEFADDEESNVDTGDADRSKAAQRTIPSWEEAIGFIVDNNMQNRSQRRPPSRAPRGNSSRGRSRGRRKS
jgi:hypothetical protein